MRRNEREEVNTPVDGGEESARDDGRVRASLHVHAADAIDHFAQEELARDAQTALVLGRVGGDVLLEHEQVALGVGFKVGVGRDAGDGRAPDGFVVAGRFGEGGGQAGAGGGGGVFDQGEGFHQVGDGDGGVGDGDVDWGRGGAVGGFFGEEGRAGRFVFEGVDYDLALLLGVCFRSVVLDLLNLPS